MVPNASDIMHCDLVTIEPDVKIPMLERTLAEANVSGLPVTTHGRLVGIVSLADVVRRLKDERDRARINVGLYGKEDESDYLAFDVEKDVADLVGERMDRLRVRDVMTEEVVTATPQTELNQLAELVVTHQVNRIPIVSEGQLVGLVTARDIIRALRSFPQARL